MIRVWDPAVRVLHWTLALGVAKELIVSDSGGSDWSARVGFSQGWVSDQVTTDDDAIDVHE